MTITIPLESHAGPSGGTGLDHIYQAIKTAKRVLVVCGAGVSTAAAIPDFRSPSGLYKGKGKAVATKDLFHVNCLSDANLLSHHHDLRTTLSELSHQAKPTRFHQWLKTLDDEGRLLRCYTQNVDGLEEKVGLDVGFHSSLPSSQERRAGPSGTKELPHIPTTPTKRHYTKLHPARIIPLHGTISTLICPLCTSTYPTSNFLPLPPTPVPCPHCTLGQTLRRVLNERQRPTGTLRTSMILYGEPHPQGDLIGSIIDKDLHTGGFDLIMVAGTSLSILGLNKMIKSFVEDLKGRSCKGVRSILINLDEPVGWGGKGWQGVFDVFVKGDIQGFIEAYEDYAAVRVSTPPRKIKDKMIPNTPRKKKDPMVSTTPRKNKFTIVPTTPRKNKSNNTNIPTTPIKTKTTDDTQKLMTPSSTPKRKRGEVQIQTESSDFVTPTRKSRMAYLPTPRATPPSPVRGRFRRYGGEDMYRVEGEREESLTPLSLSDSDSDLDC